MSIVYRSVKGSKLTSNEVDGNFQYLEGLVGGQGNAIITETGFSLVGQDLTINAGWEWKILNQSYSNASAVVLNIPLAASGNQRIDIIVANQSGSFERVSGIESASNPTAPAVPTNKLVVTFLNVNDGEILDPDLPILGTQFKKKSESAGYSDPTLSGSNAVIQLRPNGESVYVFSNAGLVSIDGFGLDLITGNPSAEVPYPGKDIFIFNNKSGNLTLKHDGSGTAQCKFFFIDETDLIIPPGGKVWLKYGPSYCEIIFKSWSELAPTNAPIILGKVTDFTHTGNTTVTQSTPILIPANTLSSGSRLAFEAEIKSPVKASNANIRGVVDTDTNPSSGSHNVSLGIFSAANTYVKQRRSLHAKEISGIKFLKFYNAGASAVTDDLTNATVMGSVVFDWTVDNYFWLSIQLGNSADSVTIESLILIAYL